VAFPASLLSTLLGCRDPRTLNGLDSKQAPSSPLGCLRLGQGEGEGRGSDRNCRAEKAYPGLWPTCCPHPKETGG
jgi:hypothetical protein